jgi:thiosulfate/3-mercaptopyruvate sulfurtransferase
LKKHTADNDLIIVDVRQDRHFDGRVIPGAIRMPYTLFRFNSLSLDLAGLFIGADAAQSVFGQHGIRRDSRVVLYDSVQKDGGATASYVYWVLDVLGHAEKKILDGGIDAWRASGFEIDSKTATLPPVSYQVPVDEYHIREVVDGHFVYNRLADPYYQIIDVRSREEYMGLVRSRSMRGVVLSPGHIPSAVNIDYRKNWSDQATKRIKSYNALQEVYRDVDPNKGVIVYCASGRRSSFSYFVLKLIGIENVYTYDASWQEWGNPHKFFPVETVERRFSAEKRP